MDDRKTKAGRPLSVWLSEEPVSVPQPILTRGKIVEVAITLADRDGLEALSIRRLGTKLGVRPMSLYRHVPSKDDLLELINDAVLGEQRLPDAPSDDWRADLRLVAHEQRTVALRHPWSVKTAIGRPVMGPNALRNHEFAMATLARFGGLSMDAVNTLVGTLRGYVFGSVVEDLAGADANQRTGMTEEQWQEVATPWVRKLVSDGRYPTVARFVIEAEHWDDDRTFAYGVEKVLDGIQQELDRVAGT